MDNKEPSLENKTVESIPAVTIRFAGDSGDGMQLVGTDLQILLLYLETI